MENLLEEFVVSKWHCEDPRLPSNADMQRIPPDAAFLNDVAIHNVLQPIMMGFDDKGEPGGAGEWFLVFGRKRLMAVRQLYKEERTDGYIWVREAVVDPDNAHYLSMIENAQRSKNPISDYADIKHILTTDPSASYKSIAQAVGVPASYVKNLDQMYAKVPDWALKGALDDKIAESVLKELSRASKDQQKKAKEYYDEKENLPMSVLDGLKRLQKNEFSAQFAGSLVGNSVVTSASRVFIPRQEVQDVLDILGDSSIPTSKRLAAAVSQLQEVLK